MPISDLPDYWWLPIVILFTAAFFTEAILETAGYKYASIKGLRFYFLMGGLGSIYIGVIWLYYGPVGGRVPSPLAARIIGGLMLFFGIGLVGTAFGKAYEVRRSLASLNRTRHVDADPEKYVFARDRVFSERDNSSNT